MTPTNILSEKFYNFEKGDLRLAEVLDVPKKWNDRVWEALLHCKVCRPELSQSLRAVFCGMVQIEVLQKLRTMELTSNRHCGNTTLVQKKVCEQSRIELNSSGYNIVKNVTKFIIFSQKNTKAYNVFQNLDDVLETVIFHLNMITEIVYESFKTKKKVIKNSAVTYVSRKLI